MYRHVVIKCRVDCNIDINPYIPYTTGVDTSKGRKCLRCRKCIVSTNYDKYLRS